MSATNDFSQSRRNLLRGLGASALIAAAPGSARAQAGGLQKMSLFIGTTAHFGSIIVAQEKGYFAKEGLPVEITTFSSGSVATEALQAGRGSAVNSGDFPALRLWNRGAAVGLCPTHSNGHMSILVARKGIAKPEDLRGRKVGVLLGSSSEYFARRYLASGKVDPKELDIVGLQGAEMVTGIVRKDIDAFFLWEPFGTRAMQATPDVYIVTNQGKYYLEWMITSTTKEYANTHEAELVAFVRALDASSRWCNQNREESAQVVATNLKLDVPSIRAAMDGMNWTVAYTPQFRESMDQLGVFLNQKLDWAQMFDTRPLKKVNPALVS